MERRRVSFVGTVQGVGFRATARWVAGRFPVTGWVRNEPDGSVLLELQGEAAPVAAYLEALRRAMAGKIEHEQETQAAIVEGEVRFEIRR